MVDNDNEPESTEPVEAAADKPAKKTAKKKTAKKKKTARKKKKHAVKCKYLVIVESPAKARTINRYLGKDYTVHASMGHVRDLPKSKLGVDLENNFEPHYVQIRNKNLPELRKLAKAAEKVYLAPDPDREGEAIAWHLIEALKIEDGKAFRVTFNEITKSAILAAFEKPSQINMSLVNAQQARRILDRLMGYQLSPLLWAKVRRGLSAGRVQSVAVRLIVERDREIDAFKPEEYWTFLGRMAMQDKDSAEFEAELRTVTRTLGEAEICPECREGMKRGEKSGKPALVCENPECGKTYAIKDDGTVTIDLWIPNEAEKDRIEGELSGATYTIAELVTKTVNRKSPPPFSTSTLQQAASTRFSYTARRTMSLAQRLYEGRDVGQEGVVGLITYMRTDSVRVADSAIEAVRESITQLYGAEFLPDKPNHYSTSKSAQDAHEAVRPTDPARTPESLQAYLDADQLKLYTLIWQRFVASQMKPAQYESTTADIVAGLYTLRARGRRLLFAGFLKVYGEIEKEESDASGKAAVKRSDQLLPPLKQGAELDCRALEANQHFTLPPPRFTEAALVRTLEREGIGRPSTYAAIIGTIQDRGYVMRESRQFLSSELGRLVNDKLVKHFGNIVDVAFTRKMEAELDEIESSGRVWQTVLQDFYEPFSKALELAKENMESVKDEAAKTDIDCPDCGKMMLKRYSRYGQFLGCSGYPDCKKTMPIPGSEEEKRARTKVLLSEEIPCVECGKPMAVRWSRRGGRRPFLGCSGYPDCKTTGKLPETGVIKRVEDEDGNITETPFVLEKKKAKDEDE